MRNRVLALTRTAIPYIKELNDLTGNSIVACLLMQQLDYWFARYPDGFFKFLSPCPAHRAYKANSSWQDELRISPFEFREAFKRIGMAHKSKRLFDAAEDPFEGNYYASYNDRLKGLTFYYRNHELLDAMLDRLIIKTPPVNEVSSLTEMKKLDLRKSRNFTYGNEESLFTVEDTTEEITKEITKTNGGPAAPASRSIASQVDEIFSFWQTWLNHPDAKLISGKDRDKQIRGRLNEGYPADYVKLAIIGCGLLPHNMGLNDRHRKFDDIELICRSSVNLESFHTAAVDNGVTDPDAWVERMLKAQAKEDAAEQNRQADIQTPRELHPVIPPAPGSPEFDIATALKSRLPKQTFDTWFANISYHLDEPANVLTLKVVNPVIRDWISSHYAVDLAIASGERTIKWELNGQNGNGKEH